MKDAVREQSATATTRQQLKAADGSAGAGEGDAPELAFRPVVLDLSNDEDRVRYAQLKDEGVRVRDTLLAQLGELVVTRDPSKDWTDAAKAAAVETRLAGADVERYGRWVHYPWRDSLVHLLGPEEFHELRTSRNRNKITLEEQARLRTLRLGVAGLSVGSSTALTLVQEGLGGEIRLADFDQLDLSNLNRLRATVLDIGVPKTTITARTIAELDPYVDVTVFEEGITPSTLDPFLDGLDMLFEECDDLAMKLRLRTAARERRMPVLMETSDRGMVDVERFDLEPERPLLHGLAAGLRADDLTGLSTYEKVPAVLRIIGVETMSERMGASLPDIDTTLKTWPQLASAVALGGALNTDVARRIALGGMQRSGRFFVDVSEIISDEASGEVRIPPEEPTGTTPVPRTVVEIEPRGTRMRPDSESIRKLVAFATLAPSGGNCQPWQFRWRDDALEVAVHPQRGVTLLDHRRYASLLAVGAALEYVCTAARASGWHVETEVVSEVGSAPPLARVRFTPGDEDPEARTWVARLGTRVTNRRFTTRQPLPAGAADALRDAASTMGASLHLLQGDARLAEAAELLAEGDRFRMLHSRLHREMLAEVRFTDAEVEATRDGIDLTSLEMDPTQVAGMRMLRRRAFVDRMAEIDTGQGLGRATRKAVGASAAIGVLRLADERGPLTYLEGGRVLARVWALATDLGLAFQPMSALLYLFERLADGAEGFDPTQQAHLASIRRRYEALMAPVPGSTDLLMFRLAPSPGEPTAKSPRMAVDQVLDLPVE